MAREIGLMVVLVPVALQERDASFRKSGPSNYIKLVSDGVTSTGKTDN